MTRIDKSGEKVAKYTSNVLQFIDSAKFMAYSLANLVNNLSEGIHKITWEIKYRQDDKKYETNRITYKCCYCFLEYAIFKNDLIEYKCLCCNKIIGANLTKS